MERSGPDDARDDAWEFDDESDDVIYPAAPIPPHERTWRHPSEMGEAAWVRSEPPVHIGRGLLVTSGAIGSALGVAVLYLLAPAGGTTPHAAPTATSSIATIRSTVVADAAGAELVSPRDDTSTSELWIDSPGLTLPPIDVPSTVLVMAPAAQDELEAHQVSVAVAIEGASYVITTANALASIDTDVGGVSLMGPGHPDGVSPLAAELVSIDGDLAYLEPSAQIEVVSFAATATAAPGQPVTVLSDAPSQVTYAPGEVSVELDASTIVEGTPVIDDTGALVALCTVVIDADGARVEFVPVTGEPAVDDTVSATSQPPDDSVPADATSSTVETGATPGSGGATPTTVAPSAWVGLSFEGPSSASPLTITKIGAGSPAMAAGVMAGERLVAIDGTPVSSVDDVVAVLRRHAPGDVIKLTLAPRSTATTASPATSSPGPAVTTTTVASTSTTSTTSSTSTTSTTSSTTSTIVSGSGSSGGTVAPTPTTGSAGTAGTRVVSVVLAAASPTV